MNELILMFSIFSAIMSAFCFIAIMSMIGDNKNMAKKLIKLERRNKELQQLLSEERHKRITAEQNEAFYADQYYDGIKDYFKTF